MRIFSSKVLFQVIDCPFLSLKSFQEWAEEPVRATVVFYAEEDRKLLYSIMWGKKKIF